MIHRAMDGGSDAVPHAAVRTRSDNDVDIVHIGRMPFELVRLRAYVQVQHA